MGTIFAPTYATLNIGCAEIKLNPEIKNWFIITTKYVFMEDLKKFLDKCQILFNADKQTLLLETLN